MTTATTDTKATTKTKTTEETAKPKPKKYKNMLQVELSDIKEATPGTKKRRKTRRIKAQTKEKTTAEQPLLATPAKTPEPKSAAPGKKKRDPHKEKSTATVKESKAKKPSPKIETKPEEVPPTRKKTEKTAETVRFVPLEEADFEPSSVREISAEKPPFKPLQELTDPISAMLAQASTSAHEHLFPSFFRIVMKYGIIALVFTWLIRSFLNRQAFGFARMTFSDATWLLLRIVLLGIFLEIIDALVLNTLAGHRPERKYILRLGDITTAGAFFLALVFSASFAVFFLDWRLGFAGLAAAVSVGILLRADAYAYTYQCGRRRTLTAMMVLAVLNMFIVLLSIQFVGGDVIRILQSYIRL